MQRLEYKRDNTKQREANAGNREWHLWQNHKPFERVPVLDSRWRSCMDNNRDALRKDASSLGDVSSSDGGIFPWQVSDTQVRDESNDSGGKLEGAMCSVQRATNFCNLLPLAYFSQGLSAGEPPRQRKRLGTAANPPLHHLISFAKRVSNIYREAFTVDCVKPDVLTLRSILLRPLF